MSFRPTTSGTVPARIAVASFDVSWFGDVCSSTTFRPGCVALNFLTSATPTPFVAARCQNVTVPFALTPKDAEADGFESASEVNDAVATAATASETRASRTRPRGLMCPQPFSVFALIVEALRESLRNVTAAT